MAKAQILFRVPEDVSEIADLIADFGPDEGVGGCTDAEEIADFLKARAGTLAEVSFDCDDPVEPVADLAVAFEAEGAPYWGTYDAFEERSRGIRVLGAVYVNLTGAAADRSEMRVPWTHGAPAHDERTLRAGGMTGPEADAVCAAFLDGPGPAPGGPR
jgi:hypothetical protein